MILGSLGGPEPSFGVIGPILAHVSTHVRVGVAPNELMFSLMASYRREKVRAKDRVKQSRGDL